MRTANCPLNRNNKPFTLYVLLSFSRELSLDVTVPYLGRKVREEDTLEASTLLYIQMRMMQTFIKTSFVKGRVHPEMKMLSSFFQSHVIQNLYEFLLRNNTGIVWRQNQ